MLICGRVARSPRHPARISRLFAIANKKTARRAPDRFLSSDFADLFLEFEVEPEIKQRAARIVHPAVETAIGEDLRGGCPEEVTRADRN